MFEAGQMRENQGSRPKHQASDIIPSHVSAAKHLWIQHGVERKEIDVKLLLL
jgi:hypothetical protein